MLMQLYLEDVAACAFIAQLKTNGAREITLNKLNKFGTAVTKLLAEKGVKSVFLSDNTAVDSVLCAYSDYFVLTESNGYTCLQLKPEITIEQLWEKFCGYLTVAIADAFEDATTVLADKSVTI